MKKTKKTIFIIAIALIILFILSNITYASNFEDLISGANGFIAKGEGATTDKNALKQDSVIEMSNNILGILIPVGTAAAVLMAAYLGIKFMTGSVQEQAKVKETLVPYIVGCIIVFGAFTIWKLVVQVLGSAIN